MSDGLRTLESEEFSKAIAGPGSWLIEFGAAWCPPCRAMLPALQAASVSFAGRINVAQVDVETAEDAVAHLRISALPTFAIFRDGNLVDRRVGAMSRGVLHQWLDASLAT